MLDLSDGDRSSLSLSSASCSCGSNLPSTDVAQEEFTTARWFWDKPFTMFADTGGNISAVSPRVINEEINVPYGSGAIENNHHMTLYPISSYTLPTVTCVPVAERQPWGEHGFAATVNQV